MRATYAGALAWLYADPSDLEFIASGAEPPSLDDLVRSLLRALEAGDYSTAEAMSHEVARLTRSGPVDSNEYVLRATPGLWRLH